MNGINFQLNTRQSNKKTAEEAWGGGGGWRNDELHGWIFQQLPPSQTNQNSKEIYANTCLVKYENYDTAWNQCHQTKWLLEVTEK